VELTSPIDASPTRFYTCHNNSSNTSRVYSEKYFNSLICSGVRHPPVNHTMVSLYTIRSKPDSIPVVHCVNITKYWCKHSHDNFQTRTTIGFHPIIPSTLCKNLNTSTLNGPFLTDYTRKWQSISTNTFASSPPDNLNWAYSFNEELNRFFGQKFFTCRPYWQIVLVRGFINTLDGKTGNTPLTKSNIKLDLKQGKHDNRDSLDGVLYWNTRRMDKFCKFIYTSTHNASVSGNYLIIDDKQMAINPTPYIIKRDEIPYKCLDDPLLNSTLLTYYYTEQPGFLIATDYAFPQEHMAAPPSWLETGNYDPVNAKLQYVMNNLKNNVYLNLHPIWDSLCRQSHNFRNLLRNLLTFDNTIAFQSLLDMENIKVTILNNGNLYRVDTCDWVVPDEIMWARTNNTHCYLDIPVRVRDVWGVLVPGKREIDLKNTPRQIDCALFNNNSTAKIMWQLPNGTWTDGIQAVEMDDKLSITQYQYIWNDVVWSTGKLYADPEISQISNDLSVVDQRLANELAQQHQGVHFGGLINGSSSSSSIAGGEGGFGSFFTGFGDFLSNLGSLILSPFEWFRNMWNMVKMLALALITVFVVYLLVKLFRRPIQDNNKHHANVW
jgi:hypothetical protein